jgi:hypothetical protein
MRRSLATVKARVNRLETRRQVDAAAPDWERLVAVMQSARTRPPTTMTPEESAALKRQVDRLWAYRMAQR